MDFRPILYVIGLLLMILAASMVFPMVADLHTANPDWKVFFMSIVVTAFFGGALILSNQNQFTSITLRQGFLLTGLSWIVLCLFAALPFRFSGLNMSLTDSVFEAVSGLTTTGSTVMTGLDDMPPGILLWRALLQWLGGIGIIIMALSVLPFLKVGGMQLFRMESSENEKALPRATKLASSIAGIYVLLSVICMSCYTIAGLSPFDAIAHAMTTIATGGFSTFDKSFGNFDTVWVEIVAIIFMILGSLPFVLYLKTLQGNAQPLFRDSQVRWFLSIVGISIVAMTVYLVFLQHMPLGESVRRAAFNVVSIITGTGYTNGNYGVWGGFAVSLFFFLMVVGGCAGSTTCGIKIFRFQVLHSVTLSQIRQLLHPHGVFTPYYNGRPIPQEITLAVLGFFFLFALSFSLLAITLSFTGLDFLTAMSAAATAISNVGPGLGDIIGPSGTFQPLPDAAKWTLCAGMLLGRLEIFTLLVVFLPRFWRY